MCPCQSRADKDPVRGYLRVQSSLNRLASRPVSREELLASGSSAQSGSYEDLDKKPCGRPKVCEAPRSRPRAGMVTRQVQPCIDEGQILAAFSRTEAA